MADEKRSSFNHTVTMEKRENVSITGVLDVISFDEETIITDTEMGVLILKGVGMHVNKLNLDEGELEIEGEIVSINYEEENNYNKGKPLFLSKLFK